MMDFLRKVAWRLPLFVAMWLRNMVLKAILIVPGFVMVAVAYRYRNMALKHVPWWIKPWTNPEDWFGGALNYGGSVPTWYTRENDGKPAFWVFYKYHALRNPGDGLRNYRWTQLHFDSDKADFWTPKYMRHYNEWVHEPKVRGYVVWQGLWFGGLQFQWVFGRKMLVIKLGFRLEPRDVKEGLPDSSVRRILGCSMANKTTLKELKG